MWIFDVDDILKLWDKVSNVWFAHIIITTLSLWPRFLMWWQLSIFIQDYHKNCFVIKCTIEKHIIFHSSLFEIKNCGVASFIIDIISDVVIEKPEHRNKQYYDSNGEDKDYFRILSPHIFGTSFLIVLCKSWTNCHHDPGTVSEQGLQGQPQLQRGHLQQHLLQPEHPDWDTEVCLPDTSLQWNASICTRNSVHIVCGSTDG